MIHNVHIMKIATIRQLRNETNTLLGWIEHGESVTITRRRKKVALLVPTGPSDNIKVEAPDFRARHKRLFPDSEMKKHNFSELFESERGRF